MTRKYDQTARADSRAATRDRIVEATVELHRAVGPARTTISAIAERAGVQRLTVYRHFPDERELFAACGALWTSRDPPPTPAPRPVETALEALYAWYRRNADMLANTERDAPALPALAEAAGIEHYMRAWRDALDPGAEGERAAALGLALRFTTWRSLAQEGLADAQAAALMARLTRG